MMNRSRALALAFTIAAVIATLWGVRSDPIRSTRADQLVDEAPPSHADVQRLNDKAADQAHAMVSVAYHFNNMWFAAEARNWSLAQFYWNETRSHLRWAVRIIPIRKDDAGREIKLVEILDAMESTPFKQLHDSITRQNHDEFVAAYKFSIETCYACHKAADKPFLRPQVPNRPAEPTINFDPLANWPK